MGDLLKFAVTDLAAFIVTEHGPVPLQAPPHPANVDPTVALAVNVTSSAELKFCKHVAGQIDPPA